MCFVEQPTMDMQNYEEICWQKVTELKVCMHPLNPYKKTTFTECCCRYGEGWGLDCALCPDRNSGAEQKHRHAVTSLWHTKYIYSLHTFI